MQKLPDAPRGLGGQKLPDMLRGVGLQKLPDAPVAVRLPEALRQQKR